MREKKAEGEEDAGNRKAGTKTNLFPRISTFSMTFCYVRRYIQAERIVVYMLRPDSQPLTGFEAVDPLRSRHARFSASFD